MRIAPVILAAALAACGAPEPEQAETGAPEPTEIAQAPAPPEPAAELPPADDPYVIVFFGDSLFAGYGLAEGEAAPDIVADRLRHPQGVSVRVVNAGRDGASAQNAVARFERAVPDEADAVVIEFGANDMFRGRRPAEIQADLSALIDRARAMGARPFLIGFTPPRRNGTYADAGLFADAARAGCADLYPYYFRAIIEGEGRSLDEAYLLPDGLHPNAAGAAEIGADLSDWLQARLARPAPCAP